MSWQTRSVLSVAAVAVGLSARLEVRAATPVDRSPAAASVRPATAPAAGWETWTTAANGGDAAAVAHLRAAGPAGLTALMAADADAITAYNGSGRFDTARPAFDAAAWGRLTAALDAVAGQKDAYTAGLYWYTDAAAAAEAARREGKPILSLRLLGNLTDEYSCANSRFFRTLLYPDPAVAGYLRDHYVLHWQSVRPVPVVTIDFGDGRVVRRTITGNSIHYVLTADGRVVDGIPGLVDPDTFLGALRGDADVAADVGRRPADDRAEFLRAWHAGQFDAVTKRRADDLRAIGVDPDGAVTDEAWRRLGAGRSAAVRLSAETRAVMTAKHVGGPPAAVAERLTMSKRIVEDPMLRVIGGFTASVATDTVRNEYDLHRRLHAMLADPARGAVLSADVAGLNQAVYADLFLTPDDDPWLGLDDPAVYTGLPKEGVTVPAVAAGTRSVERWESQPTTGRPPRR